MRIKMKVNFSEKIENSSIIVGVVGLGYVGLPLAQEFLHAGLTTYGFDVNQQKIKAIQDGTIEIGDVNPKFLLDCIRKGSFKVTDDFSLIQQVDSVSVCVPTPLSKTRDPDLSYIVDSMSVIAENAKAPLLIVLESTTYPGTTEEIALPIMEENGWELDKDYFLAFSPERVDPGNPQYKTKNIPKIMGGQSELSLKYASALYQKIIEKIHPVSSTRVAEMTKLLENTFRMVNVALVNEIALMCHHMDIDVWEVIEAAATKPFGFMPFYPGPGLGGHCLPIDPIYLSWKAKMMDIEARFIDLAQMVNTYMPKHVVDITVDALNKQRKPMMDAKILLLGVTYKKDIDDIREAPAFDIMKELYKKGAKISYHDPYVPKVEVELDGMIEFISLKTLSSEQLSQQDAIILVTDHTDYDMDMIVNHAHCVVDTRNATKKVKANREKIILL